MIAPPFSFTALRTTGGGRQAWAQDAGRDAASMGSARVVFSADITTGSPSALMPRVRPVCGHACNEANDALEDEDEDKDEKAEGRAFTMLPTPSSPTTTCPSSPLPPDTMAGNAQLSENRDSSDMSSHSRCAESTSDIFRRASENIYLLCWSSIDRARWSMNGMKCCSAGDG